MDFIGTPLAGKQLQAVHAEALDGCIEVKAAIAYAERGNSEILVFEDCFRQGKKLTFYGRADGTCPIDLRILEWFLRRKSPNAICRLVPHWLHAKIIWWVGVGAYIGSANLTDRAWFKNYEAGIFLTEAELEDQGLILELEEFFDGLSANSFPLDAEEFERQQKHEKRRAALVLQLARLEEAYCADHWKLQAQCNPVIIEACRPGEDPRLSAFKDEWVRTLQMIRDIGARAASDEYRPAWIGKDEPHGVQGDQFLHAYYYRVVRPMSQKDAYLRDFEKNRKNPEAALRSALEWWRSGDYDHSDEEYMIRQSAPRIAALFAKDRITALREDEWVEALSSVHAFGDHASKIKNSYLDLGTDPGSHAKTVALARRLWRGRSLSGKHNAAEVFDFVIWGPGEVADRIWRASRDRDFKLPHVGPNIFGEVVGWARPTEYPPRNSRTSKALRALGNEVEVIG